ACLFIYDTKQWDGKAPIAIFRHKEGIHGSGGWEQLDVITRNPTSSQPDYSHADRIISGMNWINSLYPQVKFEEKG
ncbi:MAG: hypothetical protein IK053_07760, partial [Muribaculaceae bacterium]|nr:hypothetical protein [Muribaculaceae bacterium]